MSAKRRAGRVRAVLRLPEMRSRADLQAALDAMVAYNRAWLRSHPAVGASGGLYGSGVRYKREWPRECWLLAPQLLRARVGDCEDLAAFRAAEIPGARAVPIRTRSGWHIVVQLPGGRGYEDPSRRLGMGRG